MIPSLPRPAIQRYGLAAFVGAFFVFLFVPLLVVAVFAFNNADYPTPPWMGFTLDWFFADSDSRNGLLHDAELLKAIGVSAWVALWVTLLSVVVSTCNAFLLEQHFGPIRAVEDVSFTVRKGEVLGFLGPNGAGKSTTMKMIAGFLTPTEGSISVCGFGVEAQSLEAKRCIGYLPEGAPAYGEMTPAGFLSFIADIRGIAPGVKDQRIREVVSRLGLERVFEQPIETLSKGFKRRVGLAQAILHDPKVLVLDEPTDGLDPNQKHEVRTLIQGLAKDKIVIVSIHILEEVHAVCTRAIIIANGRVVADATPGELEARSRYHQAVTVRADDLEAMKAALTGVAGVEEVVNDGEDKVVTAFPRKGQAIFGPITRLIQDRKP